MKATPSEYQPTHLWFSSAERVRSMNINFPETSDEPEVIADGTPKLLTSPPPHKKFSHENL